MNIVQVKVSELVPADFNPRVWKTEAVENLKKSISTFGMVEPILVNSAPERKNIVIGGHFRLQVAKELGFEEVPVVYVNIPDIEKEKELNLRLNKNLGEWNWEMLANMFDTDLLLGVGFTEGELGLGSDPKMEIDKNELDTSMDSYLDGSIKQIVLYFKADQYEDVLKRLEEIMEAEGVDSHTEAFLKILKTYEDTRH